jgi:PAS domain S-box-containing protein
MADWLEPAYKAALIGKETVIERAISGIIVRIHCLPLRNENGEITAGLVLAEDITDQQQAMAALIESEQRFAQFSENMHALFWMMDAGNRKPLYFSSAFKDILGISAEEVLDDLSILMTVVHLEDRTMVRSKFRETYVTGRHEMKFRIISPSGQIRWLLSRAFPIYDDTGKLYRIAGIAEDITQQTEMEKASFNLALEQERMQLLSRFIGTTSHELRTPLTIITTSLYLLRKANDPTKVDERLGIIDTQVAQLGRLVGQMHMLLRVESINDGHVDNPVSLNKLLGKLEQNLSPSVTKKELTLELVFGDDLPNLYVDPDLLLPAVQNVFENAINYTNAGRIRVQTSVVGNELVLTVEDTGIGISEDDLPHIFERFYKVEKEKKRTTVAAGLGLAITKRIMELCGGRIEAESHLGQGSIFRLSWPLPL